MESSEILFTLAEAAMDLDRAGMYRLADELTSVMRRVANPFTGYNNTENLDISQRVVPWSDLAGDQNEQENWTFNKQPRVDRDRVDYKQPPTDNSTDGGGDYDSRSPMNMNGGGDPGFAYIDPTPVMESPSMNGGTQGMDWDSSRGQNDNTSDRYKNNLPH